MSEDLIDKGLAISEGRGEEIPYDVCLSGELPEAVFHEFDAVVTVHDCFGRFRGPAR